MHEASIAQNILDIVKEKLPEDAGTRLTRITVRVGKLAGVVPECLDFAFTSMRKGTVAENAELDIQEVYAQGVCQDCNAGFPMEEFFGICPKCGSPDIEVTGGEELTVQAVDIQEEDQS